MKKRCVCGSFNIKLSSNKQDYNCRDCDYTKKGGKGK